MSAYDVLYENLPVYFKTVKEFIEILKAHGHALDSLDSNIRSVYDNFFIQTADTTVLSYYERLLNISVSPNDTITRRRERIMQLLSLIPKFDINWLKAELNELYGSDGYVLDVSSAESALSIDIATGIPNAIQLFYDFIWDVLPAHIALSVAQEVHSTTSQNLNIGSVITSTTMTIIPSQEVSNGSI